MSELDALLAGLRDRADALAKAQAAPEIKVVGEAAAVVVTETPAVAEETVAKGGEVATEAKTEAGAEGGVGIVTNEEGGETAKSFEVTLEDGTKAPAINGFALIKALSDKLDGVTAELVTLKALPAPVQAELVEGEGFDFDGLQKSFTDGMSTIASQTETMAKALATAMDALVASQTQVGELTQKLSTQGEQIAEQATLVKALSEKVTAFGTTGRGRASTVSVHEKPSNAAVAMPEQTVGDLFAKANALIGAGKLTAIDAGRINAWVNAGRGVPPEYAAMFAAA
jgi:hypothetical protein